MNPEHYVRPEGDDPPASASSTKRSALRRAARRFSDFMFNKEPDRNDPGIHPQSGFNANGRRHS
jgi:hypothetical protein